MKQRRASTGILALGSLGVVFGDIGTSPLYAFGEIFLGAHDIPATTERVLGALSLVFWTLTVIVSLKYVLIVMRADNEGEGGIMSLASLATTVVRRARSATSAKGRSRRAAHSFTAAAAFREKRCGAHLRATCLRAALRCQQMQRRVLHAPC